MDDASPLREFFEGSSRYVSGLGPASEVSGIGAWDQQLKLDEAVAAIRAGDAAKAIELAGLIEHGRTTGLVAAMIRSGQGELVDYALRVAPSLMGERFAGRTLLNVASAAGSLALVEVLLGAGADPNSAGSSHPPLYDAANESGTADVVRALIRAGAEVNSRSVAKLCTPLHMAARRGNIAVAEALLDSGAEINARDKSGDTPLKRARNCKKAAVARLLELRGGTI